MFDIGGMILGLMLIASLVTAQVIVAGLWLCGKLAWPWYWVFGPALAGVAAVVVCVVDEAIGDWRWRRRCARVAAEMRRKAETALPETPEGCVGLLLRMVWDGAGGHRPEVWEKSRWLAAEILAALGDRTEKKQ